LIFLIGSIELSNTAEQDFYEIGGDKVPSVKYILGEKRNVIGVSTSVENGISEKVIVYSVGKNQSKDMEIYALALMSDHGFFNTTVPYDFTGSTGRDFEFAKESNEDGFLIILYIDYDQSGYTITLMHKKAILNIPEPEPEPEPESEPEANEFAVDPAELEGTWKFDSGEWIFFFGKSEYVVFLHHGNGDGEVYESESSNWAFWNFYDDGYLHVEGEWVGTFDFTIIIDGDLLTIVDVHGDSAQFVRSD